MIIDIVKIGNSKGIIIPANILKELNIKDKVELIIEGGSMVIKPIKGIRIGWDESFKEMHENNDDALIIDDILDCEDF